MQLEQVGLIKLANLAEELAKATGESHDTIIESLIFDEEEAAAIRDYLSMG